MQMFYVFGNMRIKFRYNVRDEGKNQRFFPRGKTWSHRKEWGMERNEKTDDLKVSWGLKMIDDSTMGYRPTYVVGHKIKLN